MPNITRHIDPYNTFLELCDARAQLWATGHYNFKQAVDYLQFWAIANKLVDSIGQDAVELCMARAFAKVRDDLEGWVP